MEKRSMTAFFGQKSIARIGIRILFVPVFLLLLSALHAHARSWNISDYSSSILIEESGTSLVTERITCVFVGEYHGIYRKIPIEYPGPNGTNYTLFLDVLKVEDENGNKLETKTSNKGEYRQLQVFIPNAVDTKKQVVITYRVLNAVRYFDDHDEFYWNVTGNDWPVPIDHAAATVRFPMFAAGSLSAQAFTGVYGSVQRDATSKVNGAEAQFETTNPLPMRGGLTIDIYLPKDILKEPSALTKFFWFVGGNPIVFLPLVTFVGMFALSWYEGRAPDPGVSVAPMYEPPSGISPAEAGTLLDDTIHPRDITSTIVDLAVRGYIKIEEKMDKGLVFNQKDYVLHLLQKRQDWRDLAPHERVMLENIFVGDATEVRLSNLKNRFYTAVPVIREDIMSALKSKGIYMLDPESANGYSIAAGIAILIPFAIFQYMGWANFFNSA